MSRVFSWAFAKQFGASPANVRIVAMAKPSKATKKAVKKPSIKKTLAKIPAKKTVVSKSPVKKPTKKSTPSWEKFSLVSSTLVIGLVGLIYSFGGAKASVIDHEPNTRHTKSNILGGLHDLRIQIRDFSDKEALNQLSVVDDASIQKSLTLIQLDLEVGNTTTAQIEFKQLQANLKDWQKQLDIKIAGKQAEAAKAAEAAKHAPTPVTYGITAPILMYHYTPGDFEKQLQNLVAKGYTSIDLDQLSAALHARATLPSKPVIITFDDGFANQMQAFELLKKYHMKATFYIIAGGEASQWCIGANRHSGLGCGDAYLSWNQIRELDRSGLVTIAAHTVDHLNLPAQSEAIQRFQIFDSKAQLEAEVGHPVQHFAYPYGSYNALSASLVRQAGFATAVSTIPGTVHTFNSIYTLHRVRDTNKLP